MTNNKSLKEELEDSLNPWLAKAVTELISRELERIVQEWNKELYMSFDENTGFNRAIEKMRESIK